MPDGGELRLEALPKVATLRRVDRRGQSFPIQNKSANYVEVTVSDTGVGINQEALPSIFNPFFTTKPQGSGLGLSIVYRIMTEHHGEIHVDSEPNKGTTFSVLLPTEE
jgi:signal transduction histidine kinase